MSRADNRYTRPAVSLGIAAYTMRNEREAIARHVLPAVRSAMRSPWCAETGRDPYNNGQLSINVAVIERLADLARVQS